MPIQKMNLGCQSSDTQITLSDFLKQNRNIIVTPGINWCHLSLVTEEQLAQLETIFKREHIRYDVPIKSVGFEWHLSRVIKDRKWFQDPNCLPGKREKAWLISQLEEAKLSGKHTGIAHESYDELLEKLHDMPNTEDIEGYSLRYHY